MWFNRKPEVRRLHPIYLPYSFDFFCHPLLTFENEQVLDDRVAEYHIERLVFKL